MRRVGTAIIGCGNIASFYFGTLGRHPALRVIGVMDRDEERAAKYAQYYAVERFPTLESVLSDSRVELIINLTNPRSHYAISKACLQAGKHVYSEKPLAMTLEDGEALVALAREKGLVLAAAPSRVLAETAQTIWKALRANVVGKVHAVYAEMDGGLIHRMQYREWKNELDIPWPYRDEFEVGCTIEHAGYPISWLSAFFGPAQSVSAFATCQIPDKTPDMPLEVIAPDMTVACIRFKSGIVARLTSSWIAPDDHSIWIFGDTGVLGTGDIWKPRCPVYLLREKTVDLGLRSVSLPWRTKFPMLRPRQTLAWVGDTEGVVSRPRQLARSVRARLRHLKRRVDFCLGPDEVAHSIIEERPCRISATYCLHNTEVVLAIHNGWGLGRPYEVKTSFEPMEPMPWAMEQ
jgi:predicted dehydrogenase